MRIRASAGVVDGNGSASFGDRPEEPAPAALLGVCRVARLALRADECAMVIDGPAGPATIAMDSAAGESDPVPSTGGLSGRGDPAHPAGKDSRVLEATFGDSGPALGRLVATRTDAGEWSVRDRSLLAELASLASDIARSALSSSDRPSPSTGPTTDDVLTLETLLLRSSDGDDVLATMRDGILTAVHEGEAHAGTRLPSVREVADRLGTTRYSVLQLYRTLEAEGVVETRHRSGVFVSTLGEAAEPTLPDTARWLGRVLTESYLHQVKVPALPALINRWTASATIRCACAESSQDYRGALMEEIRANFGLETQGVAIGEVGNGAGNGGLDAEGERTIDLADVVVTTPYHASAVSRLASRAGKPMIVATLDEDSSSAVRSRLDRARDLTVVCCDRAFGDRVRRSVVPNLRSRIRVVTVDDSADLESIDRSEPVLMTGAARTRLPGADFRLLAAHYPSFSRRFAERLAPVILQMNIQELRGGPGRSELR